MTSHATRWPRRVAVLGGVALVIVATQYVVVSNVGVVSIAPGVLHSMTPLHGRARRLAGWSSVVVLEPLRSVFVRSAATCGAGLSGRVTRWVVRFRSTAANGLSFAVTNGALWLVAILLLYGAGRLVRRPRSVDRRPSS